MDGWLRCSAARRRRRPDIVGESKEAVWLPDGRVARAWMEYVKTGAVDDPTPPPAPFAVKAGVTPEAAVEVTWDAEGDPESGIRQFIVRRDGREITRVSEKPVGKFGRPIFQGLSFHDTPGKPLPAM